MAKKAKFLTYAGLVVLLRVLFVFTLYLLRVYIPFMISKNVFDIYEYIELFRSSNYRSYMKCRPVYYSLIKQLKFLRPELSVKFMMTVFIFVFDLLAAIMLYRVMKYLCHAYKSEDEENINIFRTTSVKHTKSLPLTVFAIYLLNPASVFYNYATNPDGYKYFLLILSIYSSVFARNGKYDKQKEEGGSTKKKWSLKDYRFPPSLCDLIFVFTVLNTSYAFLPLLLPILYIRSYHKVELSKGPITINEVMMISKEFTFSINFVIMLLTLFKFKFSPELVNPYRTLDTRPSIDFSFTWYLNQLLPVEFVKGTLFKNYFIGFTFTVPLLIGLRRYPFDYLLIMTCICIMTQPEMSVLGITFMLTVLIVNYQLLQRTQPFSKLFHTIVALLIISVFSYASWIGRYMANPNYFFGPQIIILIITCIILEDYTKIVYFRHTHYFKKLGEKSS